MWLPLREPRAAWAAAALLFATYALTMARDLSFYDSPELALVAHQLGLGHPIGEPLHTLLGFAFSHIPFVPAPIGASLLSALPGALSVLPALSLAERLCDRAPGPRASAAAALAVAFHGLHMAAWEPATRVEVYALATFLALHGLAWLAHALPAALEPGRPAGSTFLGPGAALGLASGANAVVALVAVASVLPAVVVALARRRIGARAAGRLAGGFLLGLLPWAYVPLAGRGDDATLRWGAPRDWDGLIFYLRGADFAHNREITSGAFVDHLAALATSSTGPTLLALLLAGVAASIALGPRSGLGRLPAAIATLLVVAWLASQAVFHPDITDYFGYLSLPLWLAAAGTGGLVASAVARGGRAQWGALAAVALLGAVAALAPVALPARTRQADRTARLLASGLLSEAPPDAIVIVSSDHWVAPLLYVTEAEGARPDVVVVAHGLSSSSWYWDHLFARHPRLQRIALQGPGGRDGRIRRLLEANATRPVMLEASELVERLRVPICDVGYIARAWSGERCPGRAPTARASRAIARGLAEVRAGSPPSHEVLAAVSLARGVLLWKLGRPADALEALLAGVPSPPSVHATAASLARVPRLGTEPTWQRPAAVGDPARNLFLASEILRAAGDTEGAARCLAAAGDLPEAVESAR